LLEKHGQIGSPRALKVAMALRHQGEIGTLKALLRITPPGAKRDQYAEKLRVRYKLRRAVWSGYRDAVE
jgi:hypothetical protein